MRFALTCLRKKGVAGRRLTRRGNIIVLSAFLMVIMMAMLALSIDVGYIYTCQAQLQRSVDAAALAGVGELVEGIDEAKAAAKEYLVRNPVGTSSTVVTDAELAGALVTFQTNHGNDYSLTAGTWNPGTGSFTATDTLPSALTVSMQYPNMPFFFARVLGRDNFTIQAQSTAQFQPRDIMLVLDFSASMNDDSSWAAVGKLPQATVEQSLLNCWNDLGPPVYGSLTASPTWAVAKGVAQNDGAQIPHIEVEYRRTSVYVTSTKNLTTVKLEFSNGNQESWNPSSTQTGTFQGSGGNSGKSVKKVWVKSWNNHNTFGANGEYFDFTDNNINTTLKNALGFNTVTYPYPGYGSWDGYINYVKDNDNKNADLGYRFKFGGMNLVEYWMENYPENYKIPDLWKCRAEPAYALKDATGVFIDFVKSIDTRDQMGLAIYNASDGNSILEHPLSSNIDAIETTVNHRQAGHYHQYTNIGAGFQKAREHLDAYGRPNACKMIVLMTDGLANWHNGQYNESGAAQHIQSEKAQCVAKKYKVMTISVGVGADTGPMIDVANATDGKHYNIPGGANHQLMHDQLKDAFEDIAKARPLTLVK
jgi:Flp pilus assembly protein TadG